MQTGPTWAPDDTYYTCRYMGGLGSRLVSVRGWLPCHEKKDPVQILRPPVKCWARATAGAMARDRLRLGLGLGLQRCYWIGGSEYYGGPILLDSPSRFSVLAQTVVNAFRQIANHVNFICKITSSEVNKWRLSVTLKALQEERIVS